MLQNIYKQQIITANDRVYDPGLFGCRRFNDLLLSPKRLSPKRLVAQMTVHRFKTNIPRAPLINNSLSVHH